MEANTTNGSNNIKKVDESQEELRKRLEKVGIGETTLHLATFNPTNQNMRTSRNDDQIKPGGSLEVDEAIGRSTEKFEIDMLNAVVRLVGKDNIKTSKGPHIKNAKVSSKPKESDGPTK